MYLLKSQWACSSRKGYRSNEDIHHCHHQLSTVVKGIQQCTVWEFLQIWDCATPKLYHVHIDFSTPAGREHVHCLFGAGCSSTVHWSSNSN